MLEIKNICKAYATRRKRKIYALNDVSLSFPNKGMCIIMGKSGCGKTTLLNVLGGLDARFEGEYFFLGKKLSSAKDFADFRKNYVSFIFQDFNLLDGMTVKQNLEVGYCFTDAADDKVESVLKKVGLEGYENRYPRELSGGEQQRVAIARALLKDSKVLLADEPTGNLDPTNSERIYDLLKEISKEKLVIVVSHNVELSDKYADYQVILKRGKLVSSNLVGEKSADTYKESKSSVIGAKTAFKLAKSEFVRRKVRSAITVVLMAICFCVMSFTIMLDLQFDQADMHYRAILDNDYKHFYMRVNPQDYRKLEQSGVKTVLVAGNSLHFDSKQEVLDAGFEFEYPDKTLELTDNSYYISDAYLHEILTTPVSPINPRPRRVLIDGVEYDFSFYDFELKDLIGNRIGKMGYDKVCAGIYKTPWGKTNAKLNSSLQYDPITHYENEFYSTYISTSIGEGSTDSNLKLAVVQDGSEYKTSRLQCGELPSSMYYDRQAILLANGEVVVMQRSQDYSEFLKDDEVLLNLSAFNRIFNKFYSATNLLNFTDEPWWMDLSTPVTSKYVPDQVGKDLDIRVLFDDDTVEISGLKLKGILINLNSQFDSAGMVNDSYIYFYKNSKYADAFKTSTQYQKLWVETSSVRNLHGFLSSYLNNPNGGYDEVRTPASNVQSKFADMYVKVNLILAIASVALAIVALLSMSILISGQIVSNKRAIGIYKALGARNADIVKIYVYEALMIAVPIILVAILFTIVVTLILNALLAATLEMKLTVLYYKPLNALWTTLSVAVGTFIAVFAPLAKIAKLDVIESIKS